MDSSRRGVRLWLGRGLWRASMTSWWCIPWRLLIGGEVVFDLAFVEGVFAVFEFV